MKYIEVKEFTPEDDKKYQAAHYPSTGLFIDKFDSIRAVYSMPGTAVPVNTVIELNLGSHVKEDTGFALAAASEIRPSGITSNDLLKAIAITMRPDLAKELTE